VRARSVSVGIDVDRSENHLVSQKNPIVLVRPIIFWKSFKTWKEIIKVRLVVVLLLLALELTKKLSPILVNFGL